MRQKKILMHFMRSLKAKGLLDMDIHGSVVDVFIHSELPKLVTDEDLPCGNSRFMLFKVPEFYPCGGISDCVGRYETLEAAKEALKEKGYYENCYIYDRFKDKVVYNPEEDVI